MNPPIFLDSSCFIYVFEQHPRYHDVVKPIFSMLSSNKTTAFTSTITVTEVLTKPYKENAYELVDLYLEAFSHIPNLTILNPSYETAVEAAKIRAEYSLNLPDAYQLTLAKESGCKSFLTNDKNLKRFKGVKVILLDEIVK